VLALVGQPAHNAGMVDPARTVDRPDAVFDPKPDAGLIPSPEFRTEQPRTAGRDTPGIHHDLNLA